MNKFKKFIIKCLKTIKSIPWYGWVAAIVIFGLQYGLYRLAPVIANAIGSVNRAYIPKIPFDDQIPLIPFFVIFYALSYLLWFIAPLAASLTKKENFFNFTIGITTALLIGFVIFIAAPTYMDREAEGIIDIGKQGGFFNQFLQLIYNSDNGTMAFNLMPSYHCLLGLYCYLGIHKQKETPLPYKIFTISLVLLSSLSTVFTKQHYILDTLGGFIVTIFTCALIEIFNPGEKIVEYQERKIKARN